MRVLPSLPLLLLLPFVLPFVAGSQHKFHQHDKVLVEVDTVGPYHNPSMRIDFYSLPVCTPDKIVRTKSSLGDNLSGSARHNSVYDIRYRDHVSFQAVCKKTLTPSEIDKFIDAIENAFSFNMFVDDLPVSGFLGEKTVQAEEFGDHSHDVVKYHLYTHFVFGLLFNNDGNVIACNISTDSRRNVLLEHNEKGIEVEFSFETQWEQLDVPFEERMEVHSQQLWGDPAMQIHWLSIINSFVLVLLLTAFLAIILMRVLRNDFARYMEADSEELGDNVDDSGWKQVHGDVFRFPENIMLFSAMIGTGAQLFVLFCSLLFLSVVGTFIPGRTGTMYSAGVFLYAFTAGIAGFVSGNLYKQFGGDKWATNAILTASMFTVPFIATFAVLNSMAIAYGSTVAMPFGTIVAMVFLWAMVTFPLTVLGASRGRQMARRFEAPCKTNRVRREIPKGPWHQSSFVQMFLAGFLPFSGQYIELLFLFSAMWGQYVYRLYGMLFIAFFVTVIITSFITIALTYFQLSAEDHRWWWRSLLNGGSTGIFVYLYSIFFFLYRSAMSGPLQTAFFFGYMLMISYAIFLMFGAVGVASSLTFVRHIYRSIKSD